MKRADGLGAEGKLVCDFFERLPARMSCITRSSRAESFIMGRLGAATRFNGQPFRHRRTYVPASTGNFFDGVEQIFRCGLLCLNTAPAPP